MRGLRRLCGTKARPEARAISITAVPPSPMTPQRASRGCPNGPVTVLVNTCPPVASTSACRVPSPPSATGAKTVSARGAAAATPRAMACAASSPEIPALKPWGAITIFIGSDYTPKPGAPLHKMPDTRHEATCYNRGKDGGVSCQPFPFIYEIAWAILNQEVAPCLQQGSPRLPGKT